jgi:N-acetylneuraminic acid mutarotase
MRTSHGFALLLAVGAAGQACGGTGSPPAPTSPPTSQAHSPFPGASGVAWESLPPAPSRRTEIAAATDGRLIYVAGGFAESGATVRTVEIFDPSTGEWSSAPDLPIPVNHAMASALDGTVVVVGGYLGPLRDPSDRAFALRVDRWEELPAMPEPRAAAGAATVDGLLYVAGGVGPDGLAEEMLVFDPRIQQWSTVPGPPTPREHLGVAAFGGLLYVVGGRTGGIGTNLGTAEAYDRTTGEWLNLRDMPTPRGGIAAAATTNGFVVAAGGEAATTFEEAEAFDVEQAEWVSLPPLPTPRHGLGVVALRTRVFAVAGGPQPGLAFSGANESIDLSALRR